MTLFQTGNWCKIGNTCTECGQLGHYHYHLICVRLAVDPPHSLHCANHGCGWSHPDQVIVRTGSKRQERAWTSWKGEHLQYAYALVQHNLNSPPCQQCIFSISDCNRSHWEYPHCGFFNQGEQVWESVWGKLSRAIQVCLNPLIIIIYNCIIYLLGVKMSRIDGKIIDVCLISLETLRKKHMFSAWRSPSLKRWSILLMLAVTSSALGSLNKSWWPSRVSFCKWLNTCLTLSQQTMEYVTLSQVVQMRKK